MANTIIGRVLATEKKPTTIDDFTFWTDPELILNPFDIVKVQHVNNSYSYGVIEDIAHITDAASFLTNFISSDFGDVNAEENTLRVGMNYVTAKVVCLSLIHISAILKPAVTLYLFQCSVPVFVLVSVSVSDYAQPPLHQLPQPD